MKSGGTDKTRLTVLVAVAVALAAVLWALSAGQDAARKGRARAADVAALESERASGEAARAWLARVAAGRPADLAIAAAAAFGAEVRVSERERTPLPEGWEKRTREVDTGETALSKAAGFLEAVQAGEVPWRLEEVRVESAGKPGHGRMHFVLSAPARADAAW